MGGIYGCGCKEVYRFPYNYITYPYSSCITLFLQHPNFLFIFNYYRSWLTILGSEAKMP